MTLYEMMKLKGEGFDVSDNTWDWGTYIGYVEDEDDLDYYDKFTLYLTKNVEIERYNDDWYSPCKVCEFIVAHQDAFRKFFNEENREGYRPMDYENGDDSTIDEGFYEAYMMGLESLLVGNYSESDYKKLYTLLTL